MEVFIKGLVVGVSIAAPVGPIGVLCLQRSLTKGWRHGAVAGMGAAVADGVYGAMAAVGVVIVLQWLQPHIDLIKLTGGIFLCFLGWRTGWQPSSVIGKGVDCGKGYWREFFTTFLLTLANPLTILAFLAIFSSIGGLSDQSSPWWMVLGVFLGSAIWWLVLALAAGSLKHCLSQESLGWINRLSASVLICFGAWALLQVLM
ncbi:MAG: LysE family translocator [Motiliproteus sp.]|nr:LysE family translocator [Motiliproteus sp.]MCW9051466.1 LysE family translocator [Motiliproteus sp.]